MTCGGRRALVLQRLPTFAGGFDGCRSGACSCSADTGQERARAGASARSLLPPYLKKTRRMEAVIPWLYLKGISTNDFGEALRALFDESVRGLSPATVARLKGGLGARVHAVARAGLGWRGVRVSVGGRDISERARRGAALSAAGCGLRRAWPQALPGSRSSGLGNRRRVGKRFC